MNPKKLLNRVPFGSGVKLCIDINNSYPTLSVGQESTVYGQSKYSHIALFVRCGQFVTVVSMVVDFTAKEVIAFTYYGSFDSAEWRPRIADRNKQRFERNRYCLKGDICGVGDTVVCGFPPAIPWPECER
jgi:hypothetical protein